MTQFIVWIESNRMITIFVGNRNESKETILRFSSSNIKHFNRYNTKIAVQMQNPAPSMSIDIRGRNRAWFGKFWIYALRSKRVISVSEFEFGSSGTQKLPGCFWPEMPRSKMSFGCRISTSDRHWIHLNFASSPHSTKTAMRNSSVRVQFEHEKCVIRSLESLLNCHRFKRTLASRFVDFLERNWPKANKLKH